MLLRNLMMSLAAMTITAGPARAVEVVQGVLPFSAFADTTRADLPPASSDQPQPYKILSTPTAFEVTIQQEPVAINAPRVVPLLVMDNPPLHGGPFFIRGRISYHVGNVKPLFGQTFPGNPPLLNQPQSGVANLELETTCADGTVYFSRNDDGAGLMKSFVGQSDERPFAMPVTPSLGKIPIQLKLDLDTDATGTVTFHSVTGDRGTVPGLLLVEDRPAPAATETALNPMVDDVYQRVTHLQVNDAQFGRSFLVDEDERRLLEAERRLNEHVMANDWTQRFTIPLEMDVRSSLWFLAGAGVLCIGGIAVARGPGSSAGMVRGTFTTLGLLAFGWGMAALGRGLLAGLSLAAAGLLLLVTALLITPLMTRRRQSVELRRMELLDVA